MSPRRLWKRILLLIANFVKWGIAVGSRHACSETLMGGRGPPVLRTGEVVYMAQKGAVVAKRLVCLPPTKANRVQSPTGSLPDFRMWESCRMMPLVGRFSQGSPVSLPFRCYSIFTLNLFTQSLNIFLLQLRLPVFREKIYAEAGLQYPVCTLAAFLWLLATCLCEKTDCHMIYCLREALGTVLVFDWLRRVAIETLLTELPYRLSIRHAQVKSQPITNLQGNKHRIQSHLVRGGTGGTLGQQPMKMVSKIPWTMEYRLQLV
ncbi:hypothetical protein PR048_001451 [Dryococelus australis]|uniref:Secreted protein n=1 Tax=Dryococelus australis TaxID=614101 RepID=A0ABQ9IIS3_9NEOP|nr:hypothetical protein PR048_001451 [Dryococelus australis]